MSPINPVFRVSQVLASQFTTGIFSVDDARAIGVSPDQLARAVDHGYVLRARHGQYLVAADFGIACGERDRHLALCEGVARAIRGAVISHESAAAIHGLQCGRERLGTDPSTPVKITLSGSHHKPGAGVLVSGSALPAKDLVVVDGLAVTSLARTAVDLARKHHMPDGLIVADSALRRMVADSLPIGWGSSDLRTAVHEPDHVLPATAELRRVVAGMRGWKGVEYAREAISLADPAAESALESVSRYFAYLAGIPAALIGWPVLGESGRRYWADFLWRDQKVIGEADGKSKYGSDPGVLFAEKEREDDLRRAGYTVVRWTWNDAVSHPSQMVRRLESALR
ncbi:MAG: type IV toxin-antitoxin system AbiEi family antitoxin domain-containing protein [Actinomycetes bacterium]